MTCLFYCNLHHLHGQEIETTLPRWSRCSLRTARASRMRPTRRILRDPRSYCEIKRIKLKKTLIFAMMFCRIFLIP
jgi:hypothetical protein